MSDKNIELVRSYIAPVDNDVLDAFNAVMKFYTPPPFKVCPDCDGRKEQYAFSEVDNLGYGQSTIIRCPTCHGTGRIPIEGVKIIYIKYNGSLCEKKVFECFVDEEDYEMLSQYKWSVLYSKNNNSFYARTDNYSDGKHTTVMMHRLIMKCTNGLVVDHINHNTLDNRKCNLRCVSRRINNSNLKREMSSSHHGVYYDKTRKKWKASVKDSNQKHVYLGRFKNEIEASKAVDAYLYPNGRPPKNWRSE